MIFVFLQKHIHVLDYS